MNITIFREKHESSYFCGHPVNVCACVGRFSKTGLLGNYGESQWALANFTVPPECACICAFSSRNSVTGQLHHVGVLGFWEQGKSVVIPYSENISQRLRSGQVASKFVISFAHGGYLVVVYGRGCYLARAQVA